MSNVSNRHAVTRFVAGASKPLATQRLAKVGYKSSKANPAKYPSICASVPSIDRAAVAIYADSLLPFMVSILENAQDGILKSVYESAGGILSDITDEQISIPACISYLTAEAAGSRLSEDSIKAWFITDCSDNMTVVIADKLGFDLSTLEQCAAVEKRVNLHRDILCMLAGKNVTLNEQQKIAINNCIKLGADTDSGIGGKIVARFAAVTAPKPEDCLNDIEAF
jgi:hypothetical protein